ncbi:MAG: MFS transporter [Trebonia sp.]
MVGDIEAVAAVLIGAVVGGLIGGPMMNRFSRRYTLLAMAILYAVGAILTSISWDLGSFVAFRIITGIADGEPRATHLAEWIAPGGRVSAE